MFRRLLRVCNRDDRERFSELQRARDNHSACRHISICKCFSLNGLSYCGFYICLYKYVFELEVRLFIGRIVVYDYAKKKLFKAYVLICVCHCD
jgi:hypothetical protein